MPLNYDLHSHSIASDGTLTAAQLVTRAHAQGVDVLALTDHDVTAGLAEADAMARTLGLRLIPGVEISVTWQSRTIHVLGLNIDPLDPILQQGLAGLRVARERRAQAMGEDLARRGMAGVYNGAKDLARGEIISRTHFAQFLINQGFARNMQRVFKNFLVPDKPGYVPGEWTSLSAAIAWIRGAGGQAVIAHPARYKLNAAGMQWLLKEFKDGGGIGMEVVSGSHSPSDYQAMAGYAKQFGLLASAGSDYHGPENAWLELGALPELPAGCVPVWQDWRI